MQTVSFDVPNLLKRIKDKQYTIPQFQRPFIWKDSQVKWLIDSIARNYPIGSLLVLAQSPDIPLQARSIEAEIRLSASDPGHETEVEEAPQSKFDIYYVLDGQQRLTSIARVFLNSHPKKTYYFDLKAIHYHFDDEDANWVVARQRGKNDPERKDKNRLLRADLALDHSKSDIFVSEYFEDSDDFPELQSNRNAVRQAAARVKGIFEILRKYLVPVVILDRDAPIESICRIFETINSTGTRLTTFDLAVARYYPSPDLRQLWEASTERYPVLKRFEVDGERVLQVLALWSAVTNKKFPEPTRGAQLALDRDFIQTNWEQAAKELAQLYNWAADTCGATTQTLPNHGLLVAFAAVLVLHPKLWDSLSHGFPGVIRRYFFANGLLQGARQAANYKIGRDFMSLLQFAETGEPPEYPTIFLTQERLKDVFRGSDIRFKTLQCLLAATCKEDFLTGKPLSAGEIHQHHFFPQSLAKNQGISANLLDSIANRIPVSRQTNETLSDRLPTDYMREVIANAAAAGTLPQLKRRLENSLIPWNHQMNEDAFIAQFSLENFTRFLDLRADQLLQRVIDEIGDSLRLEDASDGDDD